MTALADARFLPKLNKLNRPYWTGGANGNLMILRSRSSRLFVHPPESVKEDPGDLVAEPVSGYGGTYSYTINHQLYRPELPDPYIVAIVELDEQEGLRLPTNIVNCDIGDVHVGMRVRVLFEPHGDIFIPLFEPEPANYRS